MFKGTGAACQYTLGQHGGSSCGTRFAAVEEVFNCCCCVLSVCLHACRTAAAHAKEMALLGSEKVGELASAQRQQSNTSPVLAFTRILSLANYAM